MSERTSVQKISDAKIEFLIIPKMPLIDRLIQHSVYISNTFISFTIHFQHKVRIHMKYFNFAKSLLLLGFI